MHALFNLDTPAGGPFPSDRFTVPDTTQNTGLRVNLPKPDCEARPSDCEDLDVLNALDGFNMLPRLSIPFDGQIDVKSVNSQAIFILRLGDTLDPGDRGGSRIGINQVVWNPATTTLFVWPDESLDQHTRYGLFGTRGLRDGGGAPVAASPAFQSFLQRIADYRNTHGRDLTCGRALQSPRGTAAAAPHRPQERAPTTTSVGGGHYILQSSIAAESGDYRTALVAAVQAAAQAGVPQSDIVSASVFTTQSATAILEKIRDQIKAAAPASADFHLGPGGSRTVFNFGQVSGITWNQQTGDNPPRFNPVQVNLSALNLTPGAVGGIAFGKYLSPDYLVHPGEYLPQVGTRTGIPAVQGMNEVYFNLYLPSGPKPTAGWPLAMYGLGRGANKEIAPLSLAATLASHGIATLGINTVGYGFGPLGTLTVNQTGGGSATFPSGGRGIDQNRDGQIGNFEGVDAAPPRTLLLSRDGGLQGTCEMMQLIRVIRTGMDVDGDGQADLDRSRIYYYGVSGGSWNGIQLVTIEPDVRATVLSVPAGSQADISRWSPLGRSTGGRRLAARRPSLVNSPGITSLAGVTFASPFFNENMPLRSSTPITVRLEDGTSREIRSPVNNTVAGAMEIQEYFDRLFWANQANNPVAYAPNVRKRPLSGMVAKPVLLLFGRGDQQSTNPANTQILLSGDLADRATFYRNDLAYAENPNVPKNAHGFVGFITNADPLVASIGRGAQEQIAVFFASNGTQIIHPEPARFFEVPIARPLAEDFGFIP